MLFTCLSLHPHIPYKSNSHNILRGRQTWIATPVTIFQVKKIPNMKTQWEFFFQLNTHPHLNIHQQIIFTPS